MVKPNRMKSSILDRLKKSKADLLKRLKAYMGAAAEGKSRSQPIKGEMKPRRAKRPRQKTWSDMVKGLKVEDELETTNSDKSGDE